MREIPKDAQWAVSLISDLWPFRNKYESVRELILDAVRMLQDIKMGGGI